MKRTNQSSKRQQKEQTPSPLADLSSFSLAAALSGVTSESNNSSTATTSQHQTYQKAPTQPRRIFGGLYKTRSPSQASLATNTSFATANESVQPNETITPGAASYFVDSSDDEDTTEGLNFGNDPLSVLSRTNSSDTTPTEISFNINNNPEETTTMASKNKKKSSKVAPMAAAAPVATPVPATTDAPMKDPPVTTTTVTKTKEEAHFDFAQNVYGTAKNVWAWGKTVPVITNLLGITEAVATKVLDTTVHMDLPAIDEKAVAPQLKKLDDDIVTPLILAVWKLVGPAVEKGDAMVIKPVLTEVVPRVLGPLGLLGGEDAKKMEEKKKMEVEKAIDSSPTPEVVPAALN
mmetsp:Transcript_12467/g.26541  ORF Transcript_12467/g.26541 Transcript_12467/m.26541 type:complete len:348 (+) Transcript_12467:178-1221(+)